MKLRLYHYWRSSSSWRVRWALKIKNLQCEYVSVDLLSDEPDLAPHITRNPLGYVPVLEICDSHSRFQFLSESVAIIEWLEENYSLPSFFTRDSLERARIRQLAQIINSDTQPLQNPNVSQFHSSDPDQQKKWNQHWIHKGLAAYETLVKETCQKFSVGNTITLADLFLVPQCYNAARHDVSLDRYPHIRQIYSECLLLDSCQASSPEKFKP